MNRFGTAAAAVLLVALPVCSDEPNGGGAAFPPRCGLLTPEPGLKVEEVPPAFVADGAEIVKVHKTKERLTVALNNPMTVAGSFTAYKKAARAAGFELVGEDNEGFEAEIYLEKGDQLGAIQIRTSRCSEATVVFINIVQT